MQKSKRAIVAFVGSVLVAIAVVVALRWSMRPSIADTNPYLNPAAITVDTPYIVLGMGCFWGAEKRMQSLEGVLDVEAGYAGGDQANPTYEDLHETELAIRGGKAVKNHAEVVKVYYDPAVTSLETVLIQFWQSHNPTQGNRQGNDIGSNYRSGVFFRSDAERKLAEKTRAIYQANLNAAGINAPITTEIMPLKNYVPAEDYHQDYLRKNPQGYCGLGGVGVAYVDPASPETAKSVHATTIAADKQAVDWRQFALNADAQLIVFEAEDCAYCRQFDQEVLATWSHSLPVAAVNASRAPEGWTLKQALVATPTIVLFRNRQEVARYTGYQGADKFWTWLQSLG